MATVMAFPSSNEIQQMHHQQRIKSVQAIEAVNIDPIIHNAPYNDGISQMQHHHYLHHQQQQQQQQQHQQHQQQQRPQPRYRLVHGQNDTMVNAGNDQFIYLMIFFYLCFGIFSVMFHPSIELLH